MILAAAGSLLLALLSDAARKPPLSEPLISRMLVEVFLEHGRLTAQLRMTDSDQVVAAVEANEVLVGDLDATCYAMVRDLAQRLGCPIPDIVYATHSEAHPSWRGKKLGRMLYQAIGTYALEQLGTFIVSGACEPGGATKLPADHVWRSLAKDHLVLEGCGEAVLDLCDREDYRPWAGAIQVAGPVWSDERIEQRVAVSREEARRLDRIDHLERQRKKMGAVVSHFSQKRARLIASGDPYLELDWLREELRSARHSLSLTEERLMRLRTPPEDAAH